MASKRKREKEKERKVPIEYNRAKILLWWLYYILTKLLKLIKISSRAGNGV